MDDQESNYIADICSALANPIRLKLVEILSTNPSCVNDICTSLNMAQGVVSCHLRILKQAGIVTYERVINKNIYNLTGPNIESIKKMVER